MMKNAYIIKMVLLAYLVTIFGVHNLYAQGGLKLTEIMGSNSTIFDADGDSPDWVEIHNDTENTVNLKGYGLSDNSGDLSRWVFPEYEIDPGEYLLIFASGKDKVDSDGVFHTNFKISEKDKAVYLSDRRGEIIDKIFIKKLPKNISYGRDGITNELVYFSSVTPGSANIYPAFSPRVKYSFRGGFYSEPLNVSLSTGEKDCKIYYTTDGSTPTVASKVYSATISIDKNTTIRAISLREGHVPGPPSGQTYFINFDNKGIGVLSVATEHEKLWDPKRGLFRDVSYKDYMVRDSLRCHLSYFDENGRLAFSQDARTGVVGASSREIMMRPLKFSADESFDPMHDEFRYRLLPKDINKYRHFQLRNNNQDGIRYIEDPECMPTMGMRNAIFSEVVRNQEGIQIRDDGGPILLFINGKNYGMMNMGEKRDNTGISENNPSVKSSDIDLVVIRDDMGIRIGRNKLGKGAAFIRHDAKVVYKGYVEDGAVEYEEISDSAKQNGNTSAVDDFISLDPKDASQFDPKSFIASMAAHTIACNTDFGMNNIAFWRENRVGEDAGPFYTYTFDFDSTFGLVKWMEDYNPLLDYNEFTKLFPEFMKKEEYRNAFIRKVDEFLNGPFKKENIIPIIEKLEKKMEPWIDLTLDLWAEGKMDKKKWEKNVEHIKKYVSIRPKYVRMNMKDFFGFPGYSDIEFIYDNKEGSIYMDTGVFETKLEGKGTYASIPMVIYPNPVKGYKFSHFIVNGEKIMEEKYTFTPSGVMTIEAVFMDDLTGPVSDICINEIVRKGKHKINDEDGQRQDWIELYNTTENSIDLTGMYLSDDEKNLTKWQFPEISIDGGEFMVILASGKNKKDKDGYLHTNFKLSVEPVFLVDSDGETVIDSVSLEEAENIGEDASGIRYPDGSAIFVSSAIATPGEPNEK